MEAPFQDVNAPLFTSPHKAQHVSLLRTYSLASVKSRCTHDFSHCCGQIPDQKQLMAEGFILAYSSRGSFRHVRAAVAAGAEGTVPGLQAGWLRGIHGGRDSRWLVMWHPQAGSRDRWTDARLGFSLLFSPGPQLMKGCCLHLVIPPQWTRCRKSFTDKPRDFCLQGDSC